MRLNQRRLPPEKRSSSLESHLILSAIGSHDSDQSSTSLPLQVPVGCRGGGGVAR